MCLENLFKKNNNYTYKLNTGETVSITNIELFYDHYLVIGNHDAQNYCYLGILYGSSTYHGLKLFTLFDEKKVLDITQGTEYIPLKITANKQLALSFHSLLSTDKKINFNKI